ncbi:SDR family NAD(P)-dependent oxidoreductase [Hyphococcus luteus]|uniref:Oxidoreductase n=1 Tax=Hyphococcus luteus TaxID=2058213 RepID=A0A2S7K3P9_9PROT|nr:SDR family NAD(P)-dependent oxidoreductase [Marinicaulis flavus]PQA87134.1 oxidoreductase [Marinicaulis flavus]
MSKTFADCIVAVTGASTGLGRAIAQGAAARGAEAVIINYHANAAEADETAALVEEAGAKAVLVRGDVGDDEDCKKIAAAAEPFGRIDALFNNAGVTAVALDQSDLGALNSEDFMRLYRVNVVGAYQMTRGARPLLEAAPKRAAVVNTSSIAALTGVGSSIAYAASKGALTTMTLCLARVLAPKIRVNAVCPGFIDTPWFAKRLAADQMDDLREHIKNAVPLKEASTAEDICGAALFLASPDARHVTGETLLVDAGAHLAFSF